MNGRGLLVDPRSCLARLEDDHLIGNVDELDDAERWAIVACHLWGRALGCVYLARFAELDGRDREADQCWANAERLEAQAQDALNRWRKRTRKGS